MKWSKRFSQFHHKLRRHSFYLHAAEFVFGTQAWYECSCGKKWHLEPGERWRL